MPTSTAARAVPAPAGGLLRVGVVVGTHRVDLAVPGALPVAELLPEVLAAAGPLDPAVAAHGPALVTTAGRRLAPDDGLLGQGIVDGALLVVLPADDDDLPVHDDVAEAVAAVVEAGAAGRRPASGAAPLVAAGPALAVGLVCLAVAGTGGVALTIAAVLLATAPVAARAGRPQAAVVAAAAGCAHAAVAGGLLAPGGEGLLGLPAAVAGSTLAVAGAVGLGSLQEHRMLLLPAVLVGVAVAASALLARAAAVDPVPVLLVVLAAATAGTQVHPRLALATTSLGARAAAGRRDVLTRDHAVAEVRSAQEVGLALLASTGLLLLLVTPLAVARGAAGAGLATACALVVAAGATRHRAAAPATTGVVAGMVGLLVVAVSALVLHPGWRPIVAAVALAVGLGATVLPTGAGRTTARWARLRDLVESVALVAVLPLLCLAGGLVPAVAALVAGAAGGSAGDVTGGGR